MHCITTTPRGNSGITGDLVFVIVPFNSDIMFFVTFLFNFPYFQGQLLSSACDNGQWNNAASH